MTEVKFAGKIHIRSAKMKWLDHTYISDHYFVEIIDLLELSVVLGLESR